MDKTIDTDDDGIPDYLDNDDDDDGIPDALGECVINAVSNMNEVFLVDFRTRIDAI